MEIKTSKTESVEQAMLRKKMYRMTPVKSETIKHASLPFNKNDSVIVTMFKSEFEEFYVTKETPHALVWEIERATFEQAEIVYQSVISLAKLAAGL